MWELCPEMAALQVLLMRCSISVKASEFIYSQEVEAYQRGCRIEPVSELHEGKLKFTKITNKPRHRLDAQHRTKNRTKTVP